MSTEPQRVANFIGGEWVGAASGRVYTRENPAAISEAAVTSPDSDAGDVAQAVEQPYPRGRQGSVHYGEDELFEKMAGQVQAGAHITRTETAL